MAKTKTKNPAPKTAKPKTAKPKAPTSVTKSIQNIKKELGKEWEYNPKTRGAINTKTGEKISRYKRENAYGLLKAQGFKSFAEKAKVRKAAGIRDFKTIKGFPNYAEKSFNSRDDLIKWLELNKNSGYKFRLKLTGQTLGVKYHQAQGTEEQTIYGEQMAFESPEGILTAELDPSSAIESKMQSVKKWTLTAKKSNL